MYHLRHCRRLHQIYIVCMVTVRLAVRMGFVPILSVRRSISIDTFLLTQ